MDRGDMEWVRQLDAAVHNFNGHSMDRARFYAFMIWQHDLPMSQRPDVGSIREELSARIRVDEWTEELVSDFECCNGLLDELRSPRFKVRE